MGKSSRKKATKKDPLAELRSRELRSGMPWVKGPVLMKRCLTCKWFEVLSENGMTGQCHLDPLMVQKRADQWCSHHRLDLPEEEE